MKVILLITCYLYLLSVMILFFRCANYHSKAICSYSKVMREKGEYLLDKIMEAKNDSSKKIYSSSMIASINRTFLFEEYLMSDVKLQKLKLSSEEIELIINDVRPGLEERISILKHMHYTITLGVICLGIGVGLLLR